MSFRLTSWLSRGRCGSSAPFSAAPALLIAAAVLCVVLGGNSRGHLRPPDPCAAVHEKQRCAVVGFGGLCGEAGGGKFGDCLGEIRLARGWFVGAERGKANGWECAACHFKCPFWLGVSVMGGVAHRPVWRG